MQRELNRYRTKHEKHWARFSLVLAIIYLPALLAFAASPLDWNIPIVASSFGVAAVFFSGFRVAPVAGLAAAIGCAVAGISFVSTVIISVSAVLQALVGGYVLRRFNVDPLFRTRREVLFLIIGVSLAAAIAALLNPSTRRFFLSSADISNVWMAFIAELSTMVVLVPFLLRWIAKPVFKRQPRELIESFMALAGIVLISCGVFWLQLDSVLGIPTQYFFLPVLFWISMRLRPRFITLSLVFIYSVALASLLARNASPETLTDALILITAASVSFLLISAQEEERRVQKNRTMSEVATLENLMTQIQSESKAKNDFIAVLSHELRNPLAPIVSSIEYLKLGFNRSPEEVSALDIMSDRVHAIRHLLDDLLDVSRISEGKIKINDDCVDLSVSIRRAIISTEHHRDELHQHLSYKEPEGPILVQGDAIRLEQVFSNLLTNASKYSNSGDTISVKMTVARTSVDVAVSDQGVGIAQNMLEAIFEPFHQIEQGKRTSKGLGIGLSLVRRLVELHKGAVTVESAGMNRGSTFTVRLPLSESCTVNDVAVEPLE